MFYRVSNSSWRSNIRKLWSEFPKKGEVHVEKENQSKSKSLEITGDWYGLLDIQSAKLRITFHISETEGKFSSTMDSLDQVMSGVQNANTRYSNGVLRILFKENGAVYVGTFKAGKISGMLTQSGKNVPIEFTRLAHENKTRPQQPVQPYPYKTEEVVFTVLLAAPGVDGPEIMGTQTRRAFELAKAPKDIIEFNERFSNVYDLIQGEKNLEKLKKQLTTYLSEFRKPQFTTEGIARQVEALTDPAAVTFFRLGPKDYLSKVKCPTLAITGSKDFQILPKLNLAGISKALKKARNQDFETVELEGLNHLFQTADTRVGFRVRKDRGDGFSGSIRDSRKMDPNAFWCWEKVNSPSISNFTNL